MIILYTDIEGGEWIPFNTPFNRDEIMDVMLIAETGGCDRPAICGGTRDECAVFVPEGDCLPRLHSIMLPTAERWDAHNRKWMRYLYGGTFAAWWVHHIESYHPLVDPADRHWWYDQGSPNRIRVVVDEVDR